MEQDAAAPAPSAVHRRGCARSAAPAQRGLEMQTSALHVSGSGKVVVFMKTGIVLEGGAIRTIFSSGVCDALLTGGIMPDYVNGVSAGIAYGVSYVSRQIGRNLDIMVNYANDKRYMGTGNLLRRDNRAYFGLKFVYETIPNELIPFDFDAYNAFPGEVEAAVTNLDTGRAEYLPVGGADRSFTILQATCALPLLFPIFHIDGKPFLDGGASDAIPFERALEKGCDRVIVVLTRERDFRRQPEKLFHIDGKPFLDGGASDAIPFERALEKGCDRVIVVLTRERDFRRQPEKLQPLINRVYRKYPNFCDTMRRRAETYNAAREKLFQLEQEGKVLLFAPHNTQGFRRTERDVAKICALWQDGYDEGMARLDEVRAFLAGN